MTGDQPDRKGSRREPGAATPGRPAASEQPEPLEITEDLRSWASFCHFSALLGLLVWLPTTGFWIPLGHLLGPLLVWLSRRNRATLIDQAGREALNFQLSMSAYGALGLILLRHTSLLSPLTLALVATDLILTVRAGVVASRAESFRYPLVFYRFFG